MKKIFVDSDVILSSLISNKGAANFLLNEQDFSSNSNFVISDVSSDEIDRGIVKLNLDGNQFKNLLKKSLKIVKLNREISQIKQQFGDYTFDEDDAHIVAGAREAKAQIILSYNIKHFNKLKIFEDFGISVLTPAQFLQHLRSLN